jgi:hypothetical protein
LGSFWGFGLSKSFLGDFWEVFGRNLGKLRRSKMRRKTYKGRCEKRNLEKFTSICKTYDPIQSAYANILVKNKDIAEVRCNVALDDDCSEYMTDFVCTKTNGDLMVRECISTKLLEKPLSMKLLDMSRTYWLRHGVSDWGIVVDAAEE